MPVILRLDGKCFHSLTRKCRKPFDDGFGKLMIYTANHLMSNIQGAKFAYVQSDEISLLLTDFDRLTTDAWFDYNLQKIVSISASYASTFFTSQWDTLAIFDSRAFNVPKEEVTNYFIWRQQDWFRNSIQMLSQSYFSTKQLHKKNTSDMHEMLHSKGVNWANLDDRWKNGTSIVKSEEETAVADNIIFTKNRKVIEDLLIPIEDQMQYTDFDREDPLEG
jgi:tRNA(His) 5'-end guanylyltransferase